MSASLFLWSRWRVRFRRLSRGRLLLPSWCGQPGSASHRHCFYGSAPRLVLRSPRAGRCRPGRRWRFSAVKSWRSRRGCVHSPPMMSSGQKLVSTRARGHSTRREGSPRLKIYCDSSAAAAALRADKRRPEHIIPPRHADPEAERRIAEMMQHMEAPERQAEARLGLSMMHVIMHHVVAEIADDKSHQDRIAEGQAEQNPHDTIGDQHDRSAQQRRHDETQRIVGMNVMHAMNQKMDPGSEPAGKFIMEQEPVPKIFDQGPNEIAKRRRASGGPGIEGFKT